MNNCNKNEAHTSIANCGIISKLVDAELKKAGLTYFNYYKEDQNGAIVRLSNHQTWTEHYFKQGYIKRSSEKPKLYKNSNCFLWLTKDWPEMLLDAAMNFDIAHGITIFLDASDNPNEIEYISLATSANNHSINNFYINNLDFLNQFCRSFKEKAAVLIQEAEKNAFIVPQTSTVVPAFDESPPTLAPRQEHCARLLLQGHTAKEIAKQLNLSYRTIEYYLDIMKTKLKCRNKSDLILKLQLLLCH